MDGLRQCQHLLLHCPNQSMGLPFRLTLLRSGTTYRDKTVLRRTIHREPPLYQRSHLQHFHYITPPRIRLRQHQELHQLLETMRVAPREGTLSKPFQSRQQIYSSHHPSEVLSFWPIQQGHDLNHCSKLLSPTDQQYPIRKERLNY
jgi:hypothetical protein